VDGLSKLDKVEFASREHAQAESFRKMLLAMARDVRVILIKLADRLHNMQHARRGGARPSAAASPRETLDIYAPIANRLGSFRLYRRTARAWPSSARHPWRHRALRRAVQAGRAGNRREVLGRILDSVQRLPRCRHRRRGLRAREDASTAIYRKDGRQAAVASPRCSTSTGFGSIVDDAPRCHLALGALHATLQAGALDASRTTSRFPR
jgi:(p)ppGpp synthase/HD superfamily hydrolase